MTSASTESVPPWEADAAKLLRGASKQIRLVGQATPVNLPAELAALRESFGRQSPREPRFHYAVRRYDDLIDALERGAEALTAQTPDRLGQLYAERMSELAIEARLCASVGQARFLELASKRYPRRDRFDDEADALCKTWIKPSDATAVLENKASATIKTDDMRDTRSLVRQMQAMVGKLRLPVRVVLSSRLSAIAATGAGVVYVGAGHEITEKAARRTVLHEIHGHIMPRVRAKRLTLGLFRTGTRFGSDDQEGRALCLEVEADLLGIERKNELARRHLACRILGAGASFVDTVHALRQLDTPLSDALRIAARAHRGGGLGRERVYLPAMLRVREARKRPRVDDILSCGRVSVPAAPVLAPWTRHQLADDDHRSAGL